jgi:hypothetical protein
MQSDVLTQSGVSGINSSLSATASASTNTKGSWSEICDSTPIECDSFQLYAFVTPTLRNYLIDIGIGAVGQEVVIVENIQLHSGTTESPAAPMLIPIKIPAGSRIAARCQSTTGSSTAAVSITLHKEGMYIPLDNNRATTYGANTADSGGADLDPGGSAGVYGTWQQIVSTTVEDIRFMNICLGSRVNTVMANSDCNVQVAYGPAGQEITIMPNMTMRSLTTTDWFLPCWWWAPVYVPGGNRLVARARSNITDATDRLLEIVAIGYS